MPRNLLNSTENNDAYLINMYLNDSRQYPSPDYTSEKQKLSNDPLQNRKKSTPATTTAAKLPQVTTVGETVPKAGSTHLEEAVSRTGASLHPPLSLEAVMEIFKHSMRSSDASYSANLQSATKSAEKFVLKPKPMRKIPKNSDLLAGNLSEIPQTLSILQTPAPLPAQPLTSSTKKLPWPKYQSLQGTLYQPENVVALGTKKPKDAKDAAETTSEPQPLRRSKRLPPRRSTDSEEDGVPTKSKRSKPSAQ